MILKNLWRRKTRTFLTALGIALGVAAVVALTAFGESFMDMWLTAGRSSNADLQVSQRNAMMMALSAVDDKVGPELRQIPGVQSVVGTVIGIVQLQDSPYFLAIGEDPKGFAIDRYTIVAGERISGRRQIMLGRLTAKNFKKIVGDRFGIKDASYEVVGIYETGASFEDGGAVIPLAEAKLAFDKRNQVSFFNVKVRDPTRVDEIRGAIETQWDDLTATRSGEVGTKNQQLTAFRSFGWFLSIFAAVVAGFGMMNTMLMSVLERTREIGVLRALGWRRRRVIGMILGESVGLALVGGGMGVALGWGLLQLPRFVPAVENLFSSELRPELITQAFAIALLLGVVGGAYPAWRAARMQPAEAMRRESAATSAPSPIARMLAQWLGSGAVRNLFRRPARTFVTVLGLGIGVGFIVALIAVVDGFGSIFQQMGAAGDIQLLAEQAKASDTAFSVIDERIADKIELRSDVQSVSKMIFGTSSTPGLPYFIVLGLDPREHYIEHFRIVEGQMLRRQNEIMIGRIAARSLKREIGEMLSLGGSRYRITGIFETGVVFEDSSGVISLRDAQKLFRKPGQVSFLGITVYANDAARTDEIAATLEQEFPELMVAKVSRFTERMNDMQVTNAMLDVLIVIAMLVGGVVMVNAMLMSVFERTQEIGVLRALGWSRWRVVRMVVVEALALSALSALVGIGLGVTLAQAFTLEPTMGSYLLPKYSTELFVRVAMFALMMSLASAVYPALRAANMQPIEALRYE